MRARRGRREREREDLCSGPGKLTQALGIGLDRERRRPARRARSRSSPRERPAPAVPCDGAARSGSPRRVELPWRFCAAGNRERLAPAALARSGPPGGAAERRSRQPGGPLRRLAVGARRGARRARSSAAARRSGDAASERAAWASSGASPCVGAAGAPAASPVRSPVAARRPGVAVPLPVARRRRRSSSAGAGRGGRRSRSASGLRRRRRRLRPRRWMTLPLRRACSARVLSICSAEVMKSCQISAGKVPPSTGLAVEVGGHRDELVGVADPHGDRVLAVPADEPGVAVVGGRAGLAGGELADRGGPAGAVLEHGFEHRGLGLRRSSAGSTRLVSTRLTSWCAPSGRACAAGVDFLDADGFAGSAPACR